MLVMLLVPAGGAGARGGAPTLKAHLSPRSRRIAGGLFKKQAQFHPHLDNGQVWIPRTNGKQCTTLIKIKGLTKDSSKRISIIYSCKVLNQTMKDKTSPLNFDTKSGQPSFCWHATGCSQKNSARAE